VSAREALEDHLARIDAVDPQLNSIVTRDDERAYEAADAADRAFSRGDRLGPLHGVPLTHKDTHDTAGLRTTYGSPLLEDNVPVRDALIVSRLRAAGVVTTGKSNVPEFAAGSHTYNPLFGTTVNPYDTSKSAAGSSGGAAAAIAAGIQASGDGSDMGGSLRTPGSFNNIVGMRPTNGRIPHALPGRPWAWLSQPGFLARTVAAVPRRVLRLPVRSRAASSTGRSSATRSSTVPVRDCAVCGSASPPIWAVCCPSRPLSPRSWTGPLSPWPWAVVTSMRMPRTCGTRTRCSG
jgi:amidase